MITDKKEILAELKKILSANSKGLKITKDSDKGFELSGTKTVTAFKKEFNGMFFASAKIQGGFVGFYFFPIYTHAGEFKDLPAELKKCLKGKSCFHFKKLVGAKQISSLLLGSACIKTRGFRVK
jgi:hypothetical protein